MDWRQLPVTLVVVTLWVAVARAGQLTNSVVDKASAGLQCKEDLKLRQLCESCAASRATSLAQCCSDITVQIQCQTPSRGRRDTSSLSQAHDSMDNLYNTLSNLRVVGRTSGPRAFLGKRTPWFYPTKRLRNNFLGKRDVSGLSEAEPLLDYLEQEDKRASLEEFLEENKRAQPDDDETLDGLLADSLDEDKRGRLNFLGKRGRVNFLGKRGRVNFLGKRGRVNFLGKRGRVNFLGKRGRVNFLGKRGRVNFLGKRVPSSLEEEAFDDDSHWVMPVAEDYSKKRGRLNFLGKRGRLNFLGKRARVNFLGKRDMRSDLEAAREDEFVDEVQEDGS